MTNKPKPQDLKHSMLPWRNNEDGLICSGEGWPVAKCWHKGDNAALIVRRVNQGPAFDAMLAALNELIVPISESSSPIYSDEFRSRQARARAAKKLAEDSK